MNVLLALLLAAAGLEPIDGEIEVGDGTVLRHTLHRGDEAGAGPALLVRTPYLRQSLASRAEHFAGLGFRVVVQDCRGTGDSGGEWRPFFAESEDGAATLRWILEQPWCDGRVSTWGPSYIGITQWRLLPHCDDRVNASVLLFTSADAYRDVVHFGGVQSQAIALSWALATSGGPTRPRRSEIPLIEADDASGRDVEFWNEWCRHPTRDEFWAPLSTELDDPELGGAVLSVAGWYDLFQPGQLDDFQALQSRPGAVEQRFARLIVGPWDHSGPAGESAAATAAVEREIDRFLARFGTGEPNGYETEAAVRAWVLGADEWRDFDAWPPSAAEPASLYLHSAGHAERAGGDGLLTKRPPRHQEPPDHYDYDPEKPAPSFATNLWTPRSSLADLRTSVLRQDVLTYQTQPLREPVLVAGPVECRLFVSSDAPQTDFAVALATMAPDGRLAWRTEGIQRTSARSGGADVDGALSADGELVTVRMGHTACRVAAGHRLVVLVSSSNYPRFSRNLNAAGNNADNRIARIARQTLYHDPARPSELRFYRVETQQ